MRILLINPPVYDFTCYDYWLKPLGILYISDYLRKNGHQTSLFDFMDRKSPHLDEKTEDRWCSTGKFRKEHAEAPESIKDVRRPFFRYGVSRNKFIQYLDKNQFDAVFITSMMTYWYLGIRETVNDVRTAAPGAKILLGGVYARLLPEHASGRGADYVYSGGLEGLNEFLNASGIICRDDFGWEELIPAYDMYQELSSAAVITTTGCPYSCSYCAVPKLYGGFRQFGIDYAKQQFDSLEKLGAKDVTFYDDALLFDSKNHFLPMFRMIEKEGYPFRFNFSNGLGVRFIKEDVADAMKRVRTGKICLSVENISDDFHRNVDKKTTFTETERALDLLAKKGFASEDIFVYILAGLPNESKDDIIRTIEYLRDRRVRIVLNEFSPVPGTPIYEGLKGIIDDPLQTGKSAFSPLFSSDEEEMQSLKNFVKKCNRGIK